jgi:hypothetical protein
MIFTLSNCRNTNSTKGGSDSQAIEIPPREEKDSQNPQASPTPVLPTLKTMHFQNAYFFAKDLKICPSLKTAH